MAEFRTVTYGAEFHRLLLRVAGYAPDADMAAARTALAEGRVADVARAVAAIAAAAGLAPTDEEFALLAAAEPDAVAGLSETRPGQWPMPAADFQPAVADPAVFAPEAPPPLLDLTDVPYSFTAAVTDATDAAAVEAMTRIPAVRALWRAWRLSDPRDTPVRVFVLAADVPPDDLPVVAALLQQETESAVEAYAPGDELPAYQTQARGAAALLWTAEEPYSIGIARVFDGVDPVTGPWFAPDHPLLDDADRERVARYLEAGRPLLMTTQRMADVVDAGRGAVVPMSYRTDGRWVWTDTVSYYVRTHGLAPDAELLDHVRSRQFRAPAIDDVAEHRTLAALFRPAAASPAGVR
ncbi:hypothetical protein KOI35_42825 [Actinoplanes bogorensis]|uniref:Uncharacterized protein n=1 Tax=Paractinoplanes bogorensis TaxID=1610840 RepID=A0ABS5Z3I9_9ACTN|nr:hypothetical protein [Actinoplanes bogorensis]MBU2670257.1 hypothetical protein [Actinoplanes bogorensis]